ncbi:MAG: orotidine-5'-phosphate decarboxylase [Myxococcota bacterium]
MAEHSDAFMADRRIIVALDVPERERTLELATALAPEVAMVKIGLESFIAHGPSLVTDLRDAGTEVFLDLKLHDIPRTVGAAAREASSLGARLLTVHAAGGGEMIRAARDAAGSETLIIAVTVLTSLDQNAVEQVGFVGTVEDTVFRLAELSLGAGANGLVSSALELPALSSLSGVRVVPGVRPKGSAAGDQKRVATPEDAVAAGATYLVVGRPIVQAADPVAAARAINVAVGVAS